MYPRNPQIPKHCPPEFTGQYTVVHGDTMFLIAQQFGISLQDLIMANLHISDPDFIFPGDVLCVPHKLTPPPKIKCSCPITLIDFINRLVEVTTVCEPIIGRLVFVGEDSITLIDPNTYHPIIIHCKKICFVRILKDLRKGG